MSCVLRASGKNFDVDAFIKASKLQPHMIYRKGEMKTKNRKYSRSGLNYIVSKADFNNFDKQVRDAVRFVKKNGSVLRRLSLRSGVTELSLDFAVDKHDKYVARYLRLSPDLIQEAATLKMTIEISLYAVQ